MTALEFQLYPNLDHELGSSQLADLIVWLNRVVQSSHPSSSSSPLATTAVQCVSSSNDPLNSQITTGDTIPPYSIEKITTDSIAGNSDNHYRITFIVPKQYINQVCSRPIFCCGGQFELRPVATFTAIQSTSALSSVAVDGESALVPVTVDATTTDPVSVANEIVHRLCLRITGDTIDNPCPIQ